MDINQKKIYDALSIAKKEIRSEQKKLKDKVDLLSYSSLAKRMSFGLIWTDALQKALREHEIVIIPASEDIYYIDDTVIIPSDRMILAEGARIRLTEDCKVLMLRNEHTKDGTHHPFDTADKDENISISGGSWEESNTQRLGYGKTGKYDENRSFYGVSTLFLFNNIKNISLTNVKFVHTAGFSVQIGDARNAVFENIRFEECFADGIHVNGNCKNVLCKDIKGRVGDDLVALNMYDWQNSSVDFGPSENIICEDLELEDTPAGYKALRIEPGTYYYDDNKTVDCSLKNAVIKKVKGIMTFKMYYQTPPYVIGSKPERGEVGSADNIFFEDISVDLKAPIDLFDEYTKSDAARGYFGAFEFGCNMGYVSFKNINVTLHEAEYPLSRLAVIGPKSCRIENSEVFDPYLSSTVECLELSHIKINGKKAENIEKLVHETVFDDINSDGASTASGCIKKIIFDGKQVK